MNKIFRFRGTAVNLSHRKYFNCSKLRLLNTVAHRDIFLFDKSLNFDAWKALAKDDQSIKHPSSNHILAAYAKYNFEHGIYNFNQLGEFSLNIAAAHNCTIDDSSVENNYLSSTYHDILLWPDGIIIHDLQKQHIPYIYNLITKPSFITDEKNIIENCPNCHISNIQQKTAIIVSSVSRTNSQENVISTLDLFRNKLSKEVIAHQIIYLFSSEMRGHRNGSNLMILPSEDCFVTPNKKIINDIIGYLKTLAKD
eukprot:gene9081-12247_t